MEIHPYYFSWQKRTFDLIIALFLLIVTLPLLILISLVILITTGTPIIYRQKRAGLKKKPFIIYKFRVMYVGAEKNQWRYRQQSSAPLPMYKNWHDPRFVGIGRLLSRTGLDELPQLVNVLKGEMSLVGPRPLPISEAKQLSKQWDFRYQVKPGIFSQWSAAFKKKLTLKEWQRLERKTLQQGGVKYEVNLIINTLKKILKNKS